MIDKIKNITKLIVEYGFENFKFEVIYRVIEIITVLGNGGIAHSKSKYKRYIIGFKFLIPSGIFEINTELLEHFKAAAEKENLFFKLSYQGKDINYNNYYKNQKTQIEQTYLILRFAEIDVDDDVREEEFVGCVKNLGMPMRCRDRDEWNREHNIKN